MTIEDLVGHLVHESAAAASAAEIAAFETLVGHALPADFQRFLTLSGGGRSAVSLAFTGREKHESLAVFGGLRNDERYSLVFNLSGSGCVLPEHVIWIGGDAGGNPIVLSLRDDRFGEVFLIDHEVCAYDGERESIETNDENGVIFSLASTFTTYVADIGPD